jgi:hypothetical protein
MSIEKITAFPEITDVVIENDNIVSLTQGYYDIDKVTVHIQECIEMVRKYEKMGWLVLLVHQAVAKHDCILESL